MSAAAEPSMEEILASIRRIITEEPVGSRPLPDRARAPVVFSREESAAAADPKIQPAKQAQAPSPIMSPSREAVAAGIAPPTGRDKASDEIMFGRLADALRNGVNSQSFGGANRDVVPDFNLDEILKEPPPEAAPAQSSTASAPQRAEAAAENGNVAPKRGSIAFNASQKLADKIRQQTPPQQTPPQQAPQQVQQNVVAGEAVAAAEAKDASFDEQAMLPFGSEPAPQPRETAPPPPPKPAEATAPAAAEVEDQETSDEARSVFGALMAGLAASSTTLPPVAASTSKAIPRQAAPPIEAKLPAFAPKPGQGKDDRQGVRASGSAFGTSLSNSPASGVLNKSASDKKSSPPAPAFKPAAAVVTPKEPAAAVVAPKEPAAAVATPKEAAAPKVVGASLNFGMLPDGVAEGKPVDAANTAGAEATAAKQSPRPPVTAPASDPVAAIANPAVALQADVTAPAAAPAPSVGSSTVPAIAASPDVVSAGVVGAVGVRSVEDIVAELLRPMLREWLSENMPRMVEKALRIELAEGLKTINAPADQKPKDR